jgi:hypothetical protein
MTKMVRIGLLQTYQTLLHNKQITRRDKQLPNSGQMLISHDHLKAVRQTPCFAISLNLELDSEHRENYQNNHSLLGITIGQSDFPPCSEPLFLSSEKM